MSKEILKNFEALKNDFQKLIDEKKKLEQGGKTTSDDYTKATNKFNADLEKLMSDMFNPRKNKEALTLNIIDKAEQKGYEKLAKEISETSIKLAKLEKELEKVTAKDYKPTTGDKLAATWKNIKTTIHRLWNSLCIKFLKLAKFVSKNADKIKDYENRIQKRTEAKFDKVDAKGYAVTRRENRLIKLNNRVKSLSDPKSLAILEEIKSMVAQNKNMSLGLSTDKVVKKLETITAEKFGKFVYGLDKELDKINKKLEEKNSKKSHTKKAKESKDKAAEAKKGK